MAGSARVSRCDRREGSSATRFGGLVGFAEKQEVLLEFLRFYFIGMGKQRMKGIQGLVVAGLLGLLAAGLNWIYLESHTRAMVGDRFIGIGQPLKLGEVIQEQHLEPVEIPARYAEKLKHYVFLYQDLPTAVGIRATRDYEGGELLLRQDYRTPPPELVLRPGEKLVWVPVNGNTFVPELVNPGDRIEFVVLASESAAADFSGASLDDESLLPAEQPRATQSIGPFRVASLGSRLASIDLARGNRLAGSEERLVGIVVKETQEVRNADRLQALILAGRQMSIGVVLCEKAGRLSSADSRL